MYVTIIWGNEEREELICPIDREASIIGMEYLHQEITLDILSRLPVESVLQCRRVCKTWRNLLRLPYFADMHVRHQLQQFDDNQKDQSRSYDASAATDNLGFLLLTLEKSSPLCYLEYDESEKSYKTVKRINHPPIKKRNFKIAMIGSCNGLICFSVPYPYGINDPVYICNPITSEHVNLPRFNIHREYKGVNIDRRSSYGHGRMVSGFGYSNNEYKVVRIIYYDTFAQPSVGRVQVYTLGDGNGWRNKGEMSYLLIPHTFIPSGLRGILANGALHWLDYKEMKIVAFDLAEEEFSLVPSPPCFLSSGGGYKYQFQLRVLGGCLCVVQEPGDCLSIWLLKKNSCEWESMFSIAHKSRLMDVYWPVALTRMGEVLLRYDNKTLVRYDPKAATLESVEDLDTNLQLVEAIPHVNSFVSLKALGEMSRRRRWSESNP